MLKNRQQRFNEEQTEADGDNVSLCSRASSSTVSSLDDALKMSNEIPIWVRGEQRWISGISEETTCGQLIDALLRDEGILDGSTPSGSAATANIVGKYVITERWRRVEQVLETKTRVWKIWNEWGETKSEVSFNFSHQPLGEMIASTHPCLPVDV